MLAYVAKCPSVQYRNNVSNRRDVSHTLCARKEQKCESSIQSHNNNQHSRALTNRNGRKIEIEIYSFDPFQSIMCELYIFFFFRSYRNL